MPKARAARTKGGGRGRLLAALLVVGLLGGAGDPGRRAARRVGAGPEVVGLEVAEATRDLQDRGLVRVGEAVASDHVHEGLVATQSLAGGERARRRDLVVLQPRSGSPCPT